MREGQLIGETTAVDIEDPLRSVWASLDTNEATLTVEESGTIQADENAFKRLAKNLFKNALEHAGEDVCRSAASTMAFISKTTVPASRRRPGANLRGWLLDVGGGSRFRDGKRPPTGRRTRLGNHGHGGVRRRRPLRDNGRSDDITRGAAPGERVYGYYGYSKGLGLRYSFSVFEGYLIDIR